MRKFASFGGYQFGSTVMDTRQCEDGQVSTDSTTHDESCPERSCLLRQVAELVPTSIGTDCVRIGIDGVDGSGKTIFADALADVLKISGRGVVRISVDDFHNVSAVRYRRGRSSPEGFWLDSFNYERLRADVLEPLGPGGSRRYRSTAHDLASDRVLNPAHKVAPPGSIVVVDGLFLHRDELVSVWDFSIFLDVPFEVTAKRMAARDGTVPDPQHASMRRYVEAQQLYLGMCAPQQQASIVIDNAVLDAPHLVRVP
jgi:uridine kinase